MPLPELPKYHGSQEADFGLAFRKWWSKHPIRGSFELKHTRGKSSIPFKAIESEQIAFALACGSRSGALSRISVGTPGTGDYLGFVNDPAWIVIRYPKASYVISIGNFLFAKDNCARKSLTEEYAQEIATYSF